jgi:hypothetical protein
LSQYELPKTRATKVIDFGENLRIKRLPIMDKYVGAPASERAADPFCPSLPGSGAIELSEYGVQPLPRQSKYPQVSLGSERE